MTDDMTAYCGLVCTECPAYQATIADDRELMESTAKMWSEAFGDTMDPDTLWCEGCQVLEGRKGMFCGMCKVRACAMERDRDNCATCPDYACETLEAFFKMAPEARTKLEELRGAG